VRIERKTPSQQTNA